MMMFWEILQDRSEPQVWEQFWEEHFPDNLDYIILTPLFVMAGASVRSDGATVFVELDEGADIDGFLYRLGKLLQRASEQRCLQEQDLPVAGWTDLR